MSLLESVVSELASGDLKLSILLKHFEKITQPSLCHRNLKAWLLKEVIYSMTKKVQCGFGIIFQ